MEQVKCIHCGEDLGLSFAVGGSLSPVIAAILMPLSSVSVVSFATLSISFLVRKSKLHKL